MILRAHRGCDINVLNVDVPAEDVSDGKKAKSFEELELALK
jgi:hypothetical protein